MFLVFIEWSHVKKPHLTFKSPGKLIHVKENYFNLKHPFVLGISECADAIINCFWCVALGRGLPDE
jgi:hypothetical protein